MIPTETPSSAAASAALWPASPAPITRTSWDGTGADAIPQKAEGVVGIRHVVIRHAERRTAVGSARPPRADPAANDLRRTRLETLAAYHGRMLGGGSITLFHFRGIRVSVDWSWFVVLFLVILYMTNFFEGLLGEG